MDVGVDAKLNSYNKTLNIDFPKQSEVVDITNMMDIDSVFSM